MNLTINLMSYFGVFLLTVSAIPQIVRLVRVKDSVSISVLNYWMIFVGMLLMLARSIHIGDIVFIINYFLTAIGIGTVLFLAYRYK